MTVVADTSPINYLVLIGHIEVLTRIYGSVLVPRAVYEELQDHQAPAEVLAWLSAPPSWLRISNAVHEPDPALDLLDRGEQDAILLAQSIKADRLIIDDLDGRRAATSRNLPVIGTLGVLAEASRRKLVNLPQALAALQATNFHAAPELINLLLAREAKVNS